MPENTTAATELTSQYMAQVSDDLERNAKEQERVSAEVAALQEQLRSLRHDHAVLTNLRQALSAGQATAPPSPKATETAPIPEQKAPPGTTHSSTPSTSGSGSGVKRTRPGKAAARPGAQKAKKAASSKRPAATAAKADGPTLVELVRDHLAGRREPLSVAEVTTALGEAHPDRGIKTTVVRSTLEGLVSKGQAERTKQGSSVYYTVPGTERSAEPTAAGEQPEEAGRGA